MDKILKKYASGQSVCVATLAHAEKLAPLLRKEDITRESMGYSKELWNLMKVSGYDISSEEDIEKFFEDLEDLD